MIFPNHRAFAPLGRLPDLLALARFQPVDSGPGRAISYLSQAWPLPGDDVFPA